MTTPPHVVRRTLGRGLAVGGLLFSFTNAAAQIATRTAGAGADPAVPKKEDAALVLDQFKVYDKKPVPFTDANMDIPRGIDDIQAYYIIGTDEIENSGKTDL